MRPPAYRGDTLVLETTWETPEGSVRVVDCMPPRGEAPDVVRMVEGLSGRVPMHGVLRLRFDYGRVVPWVRRVDGQIVAVAGPDSVWLSTPAPLRRPRHGHPLGVRASRPASGCRSC